MIVGVAATFVAADATEKDAVVVVDADGTTFAAAADAARAAVCTLILRNILCGDLSSRVNSEEEDPRSDLFVLFFLMKREDEPHPFSV